MRAAVVGVGLAVAVAAGAPAVAEPEREREPDPEAAVDACARGTRWRGHPIDLDVKDAALPDVFRLLSDVGRVDVVVADDVAGAVTLRLRRVPWDQVLCTVAATKQLAVTREGRVYLVRTRPR